MRAMHGGAAKNETRVIFTMTRVWVDSAVGRYLVHRR